MNLHISVRHLVEFLMRSGDIDNRKVGKLSENIMQEGSRIHRKLQKAAGSGYAAEVSLTYEYQTQHYNIVVEGRADGIFQKRRDEFGDVSAPLFLWDSRTIEEEFIYSIDEILQRFTWR